jgi:predicted metal-dependent hydrolase
MRLPEALCDYVIVHELGHVVHKNHSKKFWDFLEQVLPGAKKLDKTLNNYHLVYW